MAGEEAFITVCCVLRVLCMIVPACCVLLCLLCLACCKQTHLLLMRTTCFSSSPPKSPMLVKLATTCLLDLASVSRMECLVEHGDPSPALELCRTAHVLLRAYNGDVGAEYTMTGRAYLYAGMIMDAIRLFNAAFEVAAQAGGGSPDDPRVVASSLDLADAFLCDERYADALALYASAEPFLAAAMERSVLAGGAPEMGTTEPEGTRGPEGE